MSRIVLVTGSSSGIGEATALRFAGLGDTVIFNSAHSVDAGKALSAKTPGSHYIQGDVSSDEDVTRIVEEVTKKFGRLDVLVNNAGRTRVIPHSDLESASVEVFREIFETNVFGNWNITSKFMPLLKQSNGSVVMTTSYVGYRPLGSSIPYAASKAALNHLVALLAKVVGPEVRVNAVAPGLIRTPWTADWEALHERVSDIAPLKRSGLPTDIADAIVAIALSPYVTGQVLVVDGGLSLVQ